MEVIKTIQELLSGKVVVLTDENLENFLQKCKLTCSDAYSGGYPFSISGDIRSVPS